MSGGLEPRAAGSGSSVSSRSSRLSRPRAAKAGRAALLGVLAVSLSARAAAPAPAVAPRGPIIEFARRPDGSPPPPLPGPPRPVESAAWSSACSFRHAVCVHAPRATPPSRLLAALSAADRAWDVLGGALDLPLPDTDLDGAWDVYVADDVPGGGQAFLDGIDPRARLDSGTSFGLIDRAAAPGCALDRALARALARAALWRAAPATDEGTASAQTEALARLAVPCADTEVDALEFQSHPDRTLVDPSSSAFDRGAALFFDWLDATFAQEPGGVVRGLWALATTRTPPGAWRWSAAPTSFDVLRATVKGALPADSTIDDVFVRFAVERARATPPVRLAWHVPWPALARRLASPEPVSPTGASYVLVDHATAPPTAKLRLEAQWEDYGRMRWVVVKLDAAGRPMAEMPVTSLDRATRASLTVESLEGVDRLLIVGVNVGSTETPFDPDQGEWEAHGWLLTLEAE